MVSDPAPPPSSAPRPGNPFSNGLLSRLFLNEEGLRSGWSVILYLAFWYAGLWTLTFCVVNIVLPLFPTLDLDILSPANVLVQEFLGFVSAYGAALLMARLEQRDAGLYGLPLREAFGKSFWQGVGLGLFEVSLLTGLIAAFGGYSFGKLALHGSGILRWGAVWAVAFLFVGFSEEFLFRGYVQYRLARSIGFWPAAISLSLVFGAVHHGNPGEGMMGLASVAVTGLVFAFALRRTGNLWLAVGWHASFDFGETFLFSVPDSGVLYSRHLSTALLHGPSWLTGGSIGPEGSVFSFLTLGVSALLIHLLFPAKKASFSQP
ncbi:MAG TPA: CPBP family intramembrane glutamic endopeptidase [Candidatus Angelobacter sp.]|nr:CPBP family intramembrane glutamic endopeptidase [Candidatus Angelobacter sp.]